MPFVHQGNSLTVLAPYAITRWNGVKVGNIFGVAATTQAITENMEIAVTGVFDLTKDASTFTAGDFVYWDDVAKACTSNGAGMLIGTFEQVRPDGTNALGALTGDATIRVRLNGAFGVGGNAGAVRTAHFLYSFAVDGGASCTPATSDTIPINALVYGGAIVSTTAVTAAGSATVSVGTVAGSGAASILAITGKASLSLNAVLAPTATATPFKMSAAGKINIAVATGPLTAGVIEGWILYSVASA